MAPAPRSVANGPVIIETMVEGQLIFLPAITSCSHALGCIEPGPPEIIDVPRSQIGRLVYWLLPDGNTVVLLHIGIREATDSSQGAKIMVKGPVFCDICQSGDRVEEEHRRPTLHEEDYVVDVGQRPSTGRADEGIHGGHDRHEVLGNCHVAISFML